MKNIIFFIQENATYLFMILSMIISICYILSLYFFDKDAKITKERYDFNINLLEIQLKMSNTSNDITRNLLQGCAINRRDLIEFKNAVKEKYPKVYTSVMKSIKIKGRKRNKKGQLI